MGSVKQSARSVRKNIYPRSFTVRVQTHGRKTRGQIFSLTDRGNKVIKIFSK